MKNPISDLTFVLSDIAPSPAEIIVDNSASILLILTVAALIVIAIVLIVRARRKNKTKQSRMPDGEA